MARPFAISNVTDICFFREAADGNGLESFADFTAEFGFEPNGVNEYCGVVQAVVDRLQNGQGALSESHNGTFGAVVSRLNDPKCCVKQKTVNLILEPIQAADPDSKVKGTYGFIRDHLGLIQKLATELDGQQHRVATGKRLRIVVAYASEMNSADTPYGPKSEGSAARQRRDFIETYRVVRDVFRAYAPRVEFAFSPALRADRTLDGIRQYWPGDAYVDVVGGTWYIHGAAQVEAANALLRDYVRFFVIYGKPLALIEMGGADGTSTPPAYYRNDQFLDRMCRHLASQPATFQNITFFLNRGRWGKDATLRFLAGGISRLRHPSA